MLKKILLALLVLVGAAAAVFVFTKKPEPLAADSASAQWLQAGPQEVTFFDVTLVDDTRPMQANGDFSGSDERELKTRIWLPEVLHGRAPLVIYSHGFMSDRTGGRYLAEHLASHGYIVAAMDYPLTNFNAPGGPLVKDVVNQPGDISFLIDQFLSWNAEQGNQFYQHIDDSRIAAIGLSLGGMTSTMVAFHPRLHDPRVSAAVSIAGPSYMFGPAFFQSRPLPFMMVASPIDPMISYQDNAADIPQRVPGATLVTIDGASHTGFASLARALRWMDNPDSLGCRQVNQGLEKTEDDDWSHELGSLEEGLIFAEQPKLCTQMPLPTAMNPIRQHWLNTLAVYAFLESHFALGQQQRVAARRFLGEQLPAEQTDVSVQLP